MRLSAIRYDSPSSLPDRDDDDPLASYAALTDVTQRQPGIVSFFVKRCESNRQKLLCFRRLFVACLAGFVASLALGVKIVSKYMKREIEKQKYHVILTT